MAAPCREGETAALGLVLPACLAACLLSPHHVYAFLTPPAQLGLSAAARVLEQDPSFQGLLVSPFQLAYLRPGLGWNVAGLAYYPLALLGALSFAVNRAGWRWRRAITWLALFLLSALQVRAVPFFAIAAGPMLVLNVQEYLARRHADWTLGDEAAHWALAGRLASVLGGLVLLGAAWPGWLHGAPYEPPCWAVEVDPSLPRAAAQVRQWRTDGLLGPDDRGFNASADAANCFAWFCPEEKGAFDARHPLFPAAAAAAFVKARKALSAPDGSQTPEEAGEEFVKQALAPEAGGEAGRFGGPPMAAPARSVAQRDADHLIVYDNDPQTALAWAERLQRYPAEWPLLYQDGAQPFSAGATPTSPKSRGAFADLALDADRLAYQPADDRKAPPTWPGREPAAARLDRRLPPAPDAAFAFDGRGRSLSGAFRPGIAAPAIP